MEQKVKVVVLNVNHTGNGNQSWKAKAENFNQAKYVVTESHGKVVGVYTFSSVKQKEGGRVNPRDYKRAPVEVYKKIKTELDVSRKKGSSNPVRYMTAKV